MGGLRVVSENITLFFTVVGVTGGLVFDGLARFSEARSRRVANHIALTQAHREIWTQFLNRPALRRVRNPKANAVSKPVTEEEEIWINTMVQHVNSVYYAMRNGLTVKPEAFRQDVGLFFSLPIPRIVWERMKPFQNDDLVAFVEAARTGAHGS
jgi:hypothetical protein